jgi:adenylate cyclase
MARSVRKITSLYTDLRAFSEFYNGLTPTELAGMMNTHYEDAAAIIDKEGGTVDKFIGDSVLAYFNAPNAVKDAEQRAVSAALKLKAKVASRWPDLPMSVGIATGEAVVGDFGPSAKRAFTAVGDVVTRAIQLERRSHFTGFKILVDEETHAKLAGKFPVDEHPTRGSAVLEGTKVFEIGLSAKPVEHPKTPA